MPFTLAVHLGAKTDVSQTFSFTPTGTSLSACPLATTQGGGEENIGTVWTNANAHMSSSALARRKGLLV
jgi:hypothetical protein